VHGVGVDPQTGRVFVNDRDNRRIQVFDANGNLLSAWGVAGDFPGAIRGVHGMAVDQEGNLYVAEVDNGGFQKFVPRAGPNPAYLMGKQVYAAWE
jgi:DNA-binding beta-propeller fold protein YncE